MSQTIIDNQAQLFKVLSHPSRVAILNILRDGEHCVCHIEAYLGYRQSYISQQLAILREAGLIQDRRDGWNIYYRVVQPQIYGILDSASSIFGGEGGTSTPGPHTKCPCPHCASKEIIDPSMILE
jgi:DNA-binding transcriptional ArsR family regulator